MPAQHTDITVIGSGLTGACVALELAARGRRVTLIERDEQLFHRASRRNEGKIHLGLIYAGDDTFNTARLQLEGALQFFPLLRRWLGEDIAKIGISTPFTYLIAHDSIKSPQALALHYQKVQHHYEARIAQDPALDYLGQRPERLYEAAPGIGPHFSPDKVNAAFYTQERAINTDALAACFIDALNANENINIITGYYCSSIEEHGDTIRIQCINEGTTIDLYADQVINCSWEDRFRLDQRYGLSPQQGWVHRMKYRVMARVPESMRQAPSMTMMLGPYGDVVIRDDGVAYLSWYPTGCTDWSFDLTPPENWNAPCIAKPDPQIAQTVTRKALTHLSACYPAVKDFDPLYVDAGAIVAYGRSDVDDPDSELHDRTRIGVFGDGKYFSVDPGKLTTAPIFALEAATKACA